MNKYREIYESKCDSYNLEEEVVSKITDITSCAKTWEDSYWLAKILMDGNFSSTDEGVIELLEYCFFLGLPMSGREIFFDANERLAKLYIRYGMYEEAYSKLIVLDANGFDCPDWVHLYIATSYLHTVTFKLIIKQPKYLFDRFELVSLENKDSQEEVKKIFAQFLCQIVESGCDKATIAVDEIVEFAKKIRVIGTSEFKLFQQTVCPDRFFDIEENEVSVNPVVPINEMSIDIEDVFFKMSTWLNVKLRRYLAQWLHQELITIGGKDYWNKCVKPALLPKELEKFDNYKELTDFAIDALLNIYWNNVEFLYGFHSMATAEEKKKIQEVQQIRNRWVGHFEENSWTKEKIISDIDVLIEFTSQIKMPQELQKEYVEFKGRVVVFY